MNRTTQSKSRFYWLMLVLLGAGLTFQAQALPKQARVQEFQFDQLKQSSSDAPPDSSLIPPAMSQFVPKLRSQITVLDEVNFWIYDSWLNYFEDYDLDYDGYYSRFSVEFDADTVFANVPLYAVVYLGHNDRFESIHVSSVFRIYGDSSNDSFVVDSTLVSGYPPRDYEVLIELYDAQTDELLTASDGYSDADLAYVSLESEDYDSPYTDTPVVIVEEHGGSLMWAGILALTGMVLWRRRKSASSL